MTQPHKNIIATCPYHGPIGTDKVVYLKVGSQEMTFCGLCWLDHMRRANVQQVTFEEIMFEPTPSDEHTR